MSAQSTKSQAVWNAAVTAGLVAGMLMLPGGCARRKVDLSPVMPVQPAKDPLLATQWYHQWEHQPDVPCEKVRDMVLILGVLGRSSRVAGEPVLYSMRVILVDDKGAPVEAEGSLQALLVEYPDQIDAHKALKAWDLDAVRAQRRFHRGAWGGYAVQLDWGAPPSPRPATHMLVIRWIGKNEESRFTRNVRFDEGITYEISSTTRPVGADGRDGSGGSAGRDAGGAGAGGG